MGSTRVEEVSEQLSAAVAAVHELDLTELSARELLSLTRELEVVARRVDAAVDRVVDEVDRTAAYRADGHRSTKAALVHLCRLPGAEAAARVRTARALRWLPQVAEVYRQGLVPTASVRAIARITANPRVRPFLAGADDDFADQAMTQSYGQLVEYLRHWERLADADGAEQDSERTHARRRASLLQDPVDGSWELTARFGAAQGAALAEVFARFIDAEFQTDLAAARAEHGDDVALDRLMRTDAQRRADALIALAMRAAAVPPEHRDPEPLVSILIDQTSFEAQLARLAGTSVPTPEQIDPTGRVCRTTSGHHLHPTDAVAAALIGHVRRIVIDSAGRVTDLGRTRRCFTGAAREAVLLRHPTTGPPRCAWSGCDRPLRHLQVDHVHPWRSSGTTRPDNGQPLCGHHNRLKERGFTPHRHPDGTWTLHRPDGTEITPPT
jgi:hypothetical protein